MTRAAAIALLLATALLHWPSQPADFSYDDADFVVANQSLRSTRGAWQATLAPFPPEQPERGLYRPLTNLSYAADFALYGLEARGFHAHNTLLYAAVALLAWAFYRATLPTPSLALAAALVFAAHPVHCDAVDSIAGRSELLALLFSLAAFLWFEKARLAGARRRQLAWSLATAAVTALACASKETALVLPGILTARLIATEWRRPGALRRGARLLAPSVLALLLYLPLRLSALGAFAPAKPVLADQDLASRVFTAGAVYAEYARLLVYPQTLQLDYYYQQAIGIHQRPSPLAITGLALVLAALAATCLALWRHLRVPGDREPEDSTAQVRTAALTQAAIAFAFLLPVSHLVGMGALMAERFLFAPSLGIAGLAALAAGQVGRAISGRSAGLRTGTIGAVLLALVCCAFAWRTVARASEWRDGVQLWSSAARAMPGDYRVYSNLGLQLLNRGDLPKAQHNLERALALSPGAPAPLLNLAVLFERQDRIDDAIDTYRLLIAARPDDAIAWHNLGVAEGKRGNLTLAAEHLHQSLSLNPNYSDAHTNLAIVESGLQDARRFLNQNKIGANGQSDPRFFERYARACQAIGDAACADDFDSRAQRAKSGKATD